MSILSRALIVVILALGLLAIWQRGSVANAKRERDYAVTARVSAEVERDNAKAITAIERQRVKRAEAVATQYEQEKADAESKGLAVADGLRAGNLRLQQRWQGCEASRVSDLGAGIAQPDAGADDRSSSAGRIVRAAAQCDAQVRGLQAQVRADREGDQP
ncbi:endopeptidase [Stenotrophomonas sp.]|uniref:endopeptidase n=1 Tax=Stenotrophomonas sp. TaxID=69392 RepID=UPI0028B00EE4|nr:endopeptidase [Stenotrophomonas sp.]